MYHLSLALSDKMIRKDEISINHLRNEHIRVSLQQLMKRKTGSNIY